MIYDDLTGACCFRELRREIEKQVQLTGRTWRKDSRGADHGDGRLSQRCCRWCGCTRRRKSIIRRSSLHAEDDVMLLCRNSLRRWRTAAVSRRWELVVVDIRLRKQTIRIFSKCERKKQRHGSRMRSWFPATTSLRTLVLRRPTEFRWINPAARGAELGRGLKGGVGRMEISFVPFICRGGIWAAGAGVNGCGRFSWNLKAICGDLRWTDLEF
jgi:hypothetical protein